MLSFAKSSFTVALTFMLGYLVLADVASAKAPRAISQQKPGFLQEIQEHETPEGRLQKWQKKFSSFVEKNPELSIEQAQAVIDLMDISDQSFFANTLDDERRALMVERFEALGRVLPYSKYTSLLGSLNELQDWLVKNGVVIDDLSAGGGVTCNCTADSNSCSPGYSCNTSVACTKAEGSTANGVCR